MTRIPFPLRPDRRLTLHFQQQDLTSAIGRPSRAACSTAPDGHGRHFIDVLPIA